MEQIIYSKFSNERNRELEIRTDILEDENKKRSVRKTPLFPEGVSHVLRSVEWEKRLADKYKDTCISLNHGEKEGSSVRFEYLEGKTLETMLDELYLEGNYQELLELFRRYVETIRKANGSKKFVVTDEFEHIFGSFFINQELTAADISNIDMVVGNIIIDGDRWNVIDYEWTFDFPVPVNFIIFRTIFYYVYATAKREALKEIGFYQIFGITQKEQEAYLQMEQCFQNYIISGIVPIRNMYAGIAKSAVSLGEISEYCDRVQEEKRIQVYFDRGNGYSEQDSIRCFPCEENCGERKYSIGIGGDVKGVRIDPSDDSCIVNFHKIIGKADYDYEPEIQSDAFRLGEHMLLFMEDDPKIYLKELRPGTKRIDLYLVKESVSRESVERIKLEADRKSIACDEAQSAMNELSERALVELPAQMQRAAQAEQTVADLNHRLYLAESSFHEIEGSFCWKITKPVRIAGAGLRAFFRRHYAFKCFLRGIKRFVTMGPGKMRDFNAKERIAKRSFHIYDEISVTCDMEELEKQRKESFADPRKFSVVVPLYNTPELYLRKMIESVLYQTYENLELCLADGSDRQHRYVKDICREYRYYDKRIKYKKLKKNMGIADNTNACLEMAGGDYLVLFDHDDFLHPSALYENMRMIQEKKADFLYSDENTFHVTINDAFNPHYKPDFAPDTLRSNNYICHLSVFSRELYEKVGGFRRNFDGSQDYDMILRLTEQAKRIVHIPKVLYYWRAHPASVAMNIHAKDYCITSARKALSEHLQRVGLKGTVENSEIISTYRIKYDLEKTPLVSILIPNYEHKADLGKCLDSVFAKTTYKNFEIIIVENNSSSREIFEYYDQIQKEHSNVRVVSWEGPFNYAAINNFGAEYAKGEYLILLNNDVEIITEDWIQEMLMYAQRPEVGAVGVKLFYPDGTLQHAGVFLGVGGVAGHCMKGIAGNDPGYFGRATFTQNVSCVTAACMMIRKDVFDEIGGFDEKYEVAFNDVDLCMRIRKAEYLIVFTPYAKLYHYESKSRGDDEEPEKRARFVSEVKRFQTQWKEELLAGDPYYNPNLSLVKYDYSPKAADEPSLWVV